MVSASNRSVFVVVSAETMERLVRLRAKDKTIYSSSRVINQCILAHLSQIEAQAGFFPIPTKPTSGRKTKRAA